MSDGIRSESKKTALPPNAEILFKNCDIHPGDSLETKNSLRTDEEKLLLPSKLIRVSSNFLFGWANNPAVKRNINM